MSYTSFDQRRVLVFDMNTGTFKRGWGGHGIPLSEVDNNPDPAYDCHTAKTPRPARLHYLY